MSGPDTLGSGKETDRRESVPFEDTTISVEELIPGLNTNCLTLKKKGETFPTLAYDFNPAELRDRSQPLGMAVSFAENLLYLGYIGDTGKKEAQEVLDRVFGGQIVVDLGAGSDLIGYKVACKAGAKGYVAVEPYFATDAAVNLAIRKGLYKPSNEFMIPFDVKSSSEPIPTNIPAALVGETMLTFLQRLPNNSVSILMSGIDRLIMPNSAYRAAVACEIHRVISKDGGYVGSFISSDLDGMIPLKQDEDITEELVGVKTEDGRDHILFALYRKK